MTLRGVGLRVINDQTGDEEAERRGADNRQVLRLGDRYEGQSTQTPEKCVELHLPGLKTNPTKV